MKLYLHAILPFSVMLFAGCALNQILEPSEDGTRFYRLNSAGSASPDDNPTTAKLSIEVGPVSIPRYLGRSQIATYAGENEIVYSEYHRWSESLDLGIERALIGFLVVRLDTSSVGNNRTKFEGGVDYKVGSQISEFGGSVQGPVALEVSWWISDAGGKRLSFETQRFEAAVSGGYDGYVSALNETLSQWSESVAKRVGDLDTE